MRDGDIDKAVEDILERVDKAGVPEKMSKAEWSQFLAALISDLRMRKEAADQELA